MTKELKNQLHKISQDFYDWLKQATIDNWREPVDDPIDTFCNYDNEAGAELASLYEEYENDEVTLREIDGYLGRVVEAVNNGTTVEHRGGVRENAGRKTKDASGKAVTVSFCCSPEQKEQLQKDVSKSGMKQSEYICGKLFGEA